MEKRNTKNETNVDEMPADIFNYFLLEMDVVLFPD